MARLWLTSINLNQNQLQNASLQPLGTAPTSPVLGQVYYDSATANYTLVWNGSAWVNGLSRAFHTGTQLASTISNLAATVQAYPLSSFAAPTANIPMGGFTLTGLATPTAAGQAATFDWTLSRPLSAFAAPTANIPMAGFKFTGLGTPSAAGDSAEYSWVLSRPLSAFAAPIANIAMGGFTLTGLPAPTAAGQAAEYSWVIGQVQSAAAGISSKDPVNAVATANVATMSGTTTIDGVSLVAGNRLLLTAQTTASQNGPWVIASGAWTRPVTEGGTGELDPGALWLSLAGTVNAGTQWRMSTTGAITPGTTPITIVQFGAAAVYTAGNGISLVGNAFSVNPLSGGGIVVAAGGVSVDTTIVTRKFSQTIGDGSSTSIVVTHGLGTQDVHIQVKQASAPFGVVECDMSATSTTTCTIAFATAPAANSYRVTVLG